MPKPKWLTDMSQATKIKRLNEARAILIEIANDQEAGYIKTTCTHAAREIYRASGWLKKQEVKK